MPLFIVPILGLIGFSAVGPVAGNVDPFVQRHCLIGLIFVVIVALLCYRRQARSRLDSKLG